MFRKTLSVLLVFCMVWACMLPAAADDSGIGVIAVKLNSDIDGLTDKDTEKLFEIRSDNVVYSTRGSGPVSFSDYGGTPEFGALKAGRTYYADYVLTAADGYTLPDTISPDDMEIECGTGVHVITTQIVSSRVRDENGNFFSDYKGVRIYARVVVDGNILQRIFGFVYDAILKIKAWSLY